MKVSSHQVLTVVVNQNETTHTDPLEKFIGNGWIFVCGAFDPVTDLSTYTLKTKEVEMPDV